MAQVRERGVFAFTTPRSIRAALSWHFRNEVRNCGWLSLCPCYDSKPFRISRWLETSNGLYDDVEQARYCELDEFSYESWNSRMRPWERKSELITALPEFHTDDENEKYVNKMLDLVIDKGLAHEKIQVIHPPFEGQPLVCVIKNDKVTIL